MKIRELLELDKTTLSFEVFPPKKDMDFANVEKAAFGIAQLQPSYMSVTYGAGGSTKGHTIRLAGDIQKKFNVPTIAHLTCVCATKESIEQALSQMKEAGIENILALRGVKTLKLDIPLVPETRIKWAFVPLHIAIIYILKLCLDEEIIPRCRFPCSRGYHKKHINWQKKQ